MQCDPMEVTHGTICLALIFKRMAQQQAFESVHASVQHLGLNLAVIQVIFFLECEEIIGIYIQHAVLCTLCKLEHPLHCFCLGLKYVVYS